MTWTHEEAEALIARARELGMGQDGDPELRAELLFRLGWGAGDFIQVTDHDPEMEQLVEQTFRIADCLSMPHLEALVTDMEAARSDLLEIVAQGITNGELRYVD